ncbi:MAG: hypothetical protein P4L68_10795 [Methylovirgula sp.]|nr:hypothetical protein [Methylovirgula sp.]
MQDMRIAAARRQLQDHLAAAEAAQAAALVAPPATRTLALELFQARQRTIDRAAEALAVLLVEDHHAPNAGEQIRALIEALKRDPDAVPPWG